MALNFEGRYWTEDGLLVQVHPSKRLLLPWRGHVVPRYEEDETDGRVFYWDEMGKCGLVFGTVDGVSKFDLKQRVNPQTYASDCLMREGVCGVCDGVSEKD